MKRILLAISIIFVVFGFIPHLQAKIEEYKNPHKDTFDTNIINFTPYYFIPDDEKAIKNLNNKFSDKLENKGKLIVELSKKNNVNPYLVAAISMHETANGTSLAIKSQNNPGGLFDNENLRSFKSLEDGFKFMIELLKNDYIAKGLTSLELIQEKYCPIGAINDPTGLNKNWLKGVTRYYIMLSKD